MEEFNLQEYIKILWKRKWLILTITFACIGASVWIGSMRTVSEYEAKLSFTISPIEVRSGLTPDMPIPGVVNPLTLDSSNRLANKMLGPILNQVKLPRISSEEMVTLLNSMGFREEVVRERKLEFDLNKVKIEFDNKAGVVSITHAGKDPNQVLKGNKELLEYLKVYVEKKFNSQMNEASEALNAGLTKERELLKDSKRKLDQLIKEIGGESKIKSISEVQQVEYKELLEDYILSQKSFEAFKLVMKEFESIKNIDSKKQMNFETIYEDRNARDITPKKSTNVMVGGILGLMVGILGSFFYEFIRKK